jgi:hypothetical protein
VSSWLAWVHINARDGYYVPSLADRFKECDIDFFFEMFDDELSGRKASEDVFQLMSRDPNTELLPIGLIGAGYSSISKPSSILSGAYDLPQISPGASSASLDDKGNHPRFARTITSNRGEAKAIVQYYQELQVSHIAVL